MSETKTAVLAALQQLATRVKTADLERSPNLNYQYVSYDSLIEKIRPFAVELGLFLIPEQCTQTNCTPYEIVKTNQGGQYSQRMNYDSYMFIFRLWHAPSGEFLNVSVPSVGVDNLDKGPNKAVTYAAKNAWLQVLMLVRGESEDGDRPQSQGSTQRQAAPPPRQASPPPPPPPSPAAYTSDTRTWKPEWVDYLNTLLASAKNEKAIHETPDFNWLTAAEYVAGEIDNRKFPQPVRDFMVASYCLWIVFTAMKTQHEKSTIDSVRTNWATFEKFAGPEYAAKVKARVGA